MQRGRDRVGDNEIQVAAYRDLHTESDRDRQRQTETGRDRQRQTATCSCRQRLA